MKDMTKGGEMRLILSFAIPMLIGNIFQQAYNMVDGIIVGQYEGPDALAAVGTSFPIIFLVVAVMMGLAMGASILISQFFGAKQYDQMRRATSSVLIFTFIGCVALSVIGYFASPFLLKTLLDVPDEVLKNSVTYLQIYFIGLIFMYFYNVVSALLRAVGDSRNPLYFLIVAALINIGLDWYFVAELGWGVAGVAWATLIAQGVSAVIAVVFVYKKVPLFRFGIKDFVFDRKLFAISVKLGIPSSIQQAVLALGFVVIQRLVNGFGGNTMAAFTAASKIDQLATMPIMNIGLALATFAGQNIGAGHLDRVKVGFRKTLLISAVCCAVMTGVIFLFGKYLIGFFVGANNGDAKNAEVLRQGVEYLTVVVCFYLLFSVMNTITSLLRGCGDVTYSTVVTFTAFGVRLIAAYSLAQVIGYRCIWWSLPIGWGVAVAMALIRYAGGRWQTKAVVHAPPELEEG